MELLNEYLKKAKENQWTIDMSSLANEFNLTIEQVRECVNKIYL